MLRFTFRDLAFLGSRETSLFPACNIVVPEVGEGVFESFECYELENPVMATLSAHKNWSGAWILQGLPLGVQLGESWEFYAVQSPVVETLSNGFGFADLSAWTFRDRDLGLMVDETWESYAEEDPVTATLGNGVGFTGNWIIRDL